MNWIFVTRLMMTIVSLFLFFFFALVISVLGRSFDNSFSLSPNNGPLSRRQLHWFVTMNETARLSKDIVLRVYVCMSVQTMKYNVRYIQWHTMWCESLHEMISIVSLLHLLSIIFIAFPFSIQLHFENFFGSFFLLIFFVVGERFCRFSFVVVYFSRILLRCLPDAHGQ